MARVGRKKGKPVKQTQAFKDAAKKNQFGQPGGNKPFGNRDYHPMNLRSALRHFASQPLDPRNLEESYKALLGHHQFSGAEMAAYRRLHMAINGDNHAIDKLEESLCGKLEDTLVFKEMPKEEPFKKSTDLDEANKLLEEELKKPAR